MAEHRTDAVEQHRTADHARRGRGRGAEEGASRADRLGVSAFVFGQDFAKFLRKNYVCIDVLFRLAEHSGIVLMPGGGFGGPAWSVRVSLANLPEDTYPKIGEYLRQAAEGYVDEWRSTQEKKR